MLGDDDSAAFRGRDDRVWSHTSPLSYKGHLNMADYDLECLQVLNPLSDVNFSGSSVTHLMMMEYEIVVRVSPTTLNK